MLVALPGSELRVHLGQIDDATARELLGHYGAIVVAVVRRFAPVARNAFHPVPEEDLFAIGQTAILEAHLTFKPREEDDEGAAQRGKRAWVYRTVSWRIGDTVRRLTEAEPSGVARAQRTSAGGHKRNHEGPAHTEGIAADLNGHEQQTHVYRGQLLRWLYGALGHLSPRQRVILVSRFRGEAPVDLAPQLGLSRSRVSQEYRAAVETLREEARAAGFDGVDLDK